MARITVLGGGPFHPCIAQANWLRTVLTPLGHDMAAYAHPCLQRFLFQGINWLLGDKR